VEGRCLHEEESNDIVTEPLVAAKLMRSRSSGSITKKLPGRASKLSPLLVTSIYQHREAPELGSIM
jgi:hypothetical protein